MQTSWVLGGFRLVELQRGDAVCDTRSLEIGRGVFKDVCDRKVGASQLCNSRDAERALDRSWGADMQGRRRLHLWHLALWARVMES